MIARWSWRLLGVTALIAQLLPADSGAATPVIELVTIGPERSIDTRFGHVLLRVVDPSAGVDDSYDYGVAPFHRPGFMLETALGRGMFSLRRSSAQVRFESYRLQDRDVEAQRLNLSPEQTLLLLERLKTNLQPGNTDYRYDHVLDNCATRIRDLLDGVTEGALRRAADTMEVSTTFRGDILDAGSGRLAALLGLDLLAGSHAEDAIGAWERSFLPRYLRDLVAVAENPALGTAVPLVAATERVHRRAARSAVGGSVGAGRELGWALGAALGLVFAATGVAARRAAVSARTLGRVAGLLLIPVAVSFGLLGTVMLPISLFSIGHIWSDNYNAMLFVPLDLVLLGPALAWVRTGETALPGWLRAYLDCRLLLVCITGLGIADQENGAFVAGVGCVLLGLRAQPPKQPQRAGLRAEGPRA